MPGHFLAKYASPSGAEVFVDAFRGGEMLSAEECAARFRERSGGRELERRWLDPIGARQILGRMLENLRRIYADQKDDVRAYWVLDRILLVSPSRLEALRDRGLAAARLGGAGAAVRDLEAYLERAPQASDAEEIRERLAGLRHDRPLAN